MSKTYRPWNPDQDWLLPPSPREWLPEGDLVYFMLDVVQTLDLSEITRRYEQEDRGFPPFHPRMMVTLLLYAYCLGVYSSRRIQKLCERDAAFRVIVGDDVPNFRTISDFRKDHPAALQGLFVQVLKLCGEAGLVKVGLVSLDGTKVSNKGFEQCGNAQIVCNQEQGGWPTSSGGGGADEAPALRKNKDIVRPGLRQPIIRSPRSGGPGPPAHGSAVPRRHQRAIEALIACRTAQLVCNQEQIIVAADVTDQANDQRQVQPMVSQAQENLTAAGVEEKIGALDADSGYYNEENVSHLEGEKIDPYIATERLKHHEKVSCASDGPTPENLTPKERMGRKLRTKQGRETYAKRKGMVEPIFGQIKQVRGFRQFLMRGPAKMRGEWLLICLTHNLMKLFGSGRWAAA